VTDDFMVAVQSNADWPLLFPASDLEGEGETYVRRWPGSDSEILCRVVKRMNARTLWDRLMRAAYDSAEPGVLFVDRINRLNNLWYREHLSATNPCGEIPLPPYGACDLGSINLTQFVRDPFTATARLDHDAVREVAAVAVRFLDNVIDLSRFPLEAQQREARGSRRIGLGLTGLADAFLMLGLRYGSEESLQLAGGAMRDICHTAYRASIGLAREKGTFPFLERKKHLAGAFVKSLPDDIQDGIARHGIRNSHLTAIAPTGTISLLANNVSSALEPVFSRRFRRKIFDETGRVREFDLTDYALELWEQGAGQGLPPAFVDVEALTPEAHLDIQAALQNHVDNAISKTINVPESYPFSDFQELYTRAFVRGLKGCTTFRPNPVTGEVLKGAEASVEAPHCCALEREAD
jgi:ribonucleoside-diphosphate reductase alpha chain